MEIKKVVVGELETNCYILINNNKCLVIDPGDNFEMIKESIGDNKVVGCLVTHFHPDHIGALEELLSRYNLEINKVDNNNFKFEIISTPGHTIDSKCFYFKDNNIMFTGDFIFYESIGRTDLGGNDLDMKDSLNFISEYNDEIVLYPGHGPKTTLGHEKKLFSLYY